MGMGTPGYVMPGTVGPRQQQQQQTYQQQFNNAAYAPIPGVRGPQPIPQAPVGGTFNGQPYDPSAPITGYGRVTQGLLSEIMPGVRSDWMNRNLSSADWQGFLAQGQNGMAQNHMMQPMPAAGMSGPYGQQAARMAGLLGARPGGYPSGGLLGGPKRGFRVPGGK